MKDKRYLFLILLLISAASYGQRKIKDGTVTGSSDLPVTQSVLELESINKGFLPPRLTTPQRDAISSPANGLMIYNMTTHCMEFWNGSSWVSKCGAGGPNIAYLECYGDNYSHGIVAGSSILTAEKYLQYAGGSGLTLPNTSIPSTGVTGLDASWPSLSLTTIGYVPVTISGTPSGPGIATFNLSVLGLSCIFNLKVGDATASNENVAVCDPGAPATPVVEVTSATGKIWMDRNLGASRVATAVDDNNAFGCKFQWGRANDGHATIQYNIDRNSASLPNGVTTTKSDNPGHKMFIGAANQADWRVTSTHTLWLGASAPNNPCPSGYRIPTTAEWLAEKAAYNISDANSAYSSPLRLTAAGTIGDTGGSMFLYGTVGFYWATAPDDATNNQYHTASTFMVNVPAGSGNDADLSLVARASGASVRCIKN